MRAYVIPQDGTEIYPVEVGQDSLEDLQTLVGGMIQALPMCEDFDLIINEEGKLDSSCEINSNATRIARKIGRLFPFDAIVGNAVITGTPGEEGEMTEPGENWKRLCQREGIRTTEHTPA